MAVLEKLRKRPKLLMGFIGGALLLFILTAIDNPMSLFRGNDTLAVQVGNKDIDITQLSAEQEKIQQKNPDQKTDGETLQQQAVQQIIGETLISQECSDAGIGVTDDEILNVLFKETGIDKKTFDQIKNANLTQPLTTHSRYSWPKQRFIAKTVCPKSLPSSRAQN